jgi:hypothetical protein
LCAFSGRSFSFGTGGRDGKVPASEGAENRRWVRPLHPPSFRRLSGDRDSAQWSLSSACERRRVLKGSSAVKYGPGA